MKKLISLLLAVSVMAVSTVASAAYLGAGDSQRNPGAWGDTAGNRNSNTIRDYFRADQMACFRPGDILKFTNGDQTVADGDVITFICSKRGETTLDSSTVMFIDQKVADGESFAYEYKVRDLAEGGYVINIKIGDADVKPFYFSVGNPKVEQLTLADGTEYFIQDGVAYYFAAATIGSSEVLFEQVSEEFGFTVNGTAVTFEGGASHFDAYATAVEGDATTFIFTLPVTGFADESELPTVEAYLDE